MSEETSVFISYSHDSEEHKQWVKNLSLELRKFGIKTIIDRDTSTGTDLGLFINNGITGSKFVLCVCSDRYVQKANAGKEGVGYEISLITRELLKDVGNSHIIPIIRNNTDKTLPICFGTRKYSDFTDDNQFSINLKALVSKFEENENDLPSETSPAEPSLALTLNGADTVSLTLQDMPKQEGQKLEALMAPLDIVNTDFVKVGMLPNSFALFEHDALQILDNRTPPELNMYSDTSNMKKAQNNFRKYITRKTLPIYLMYWKLSFFIAGVEELQCEVTNNTPNALHDVSVCISKPENAYFIEAEEKYFLQDFNKLRTEGQHILNPLQIARAEYLSQQTGRCTNYGTEWIEFDGAFPVQPDNSHIKIGNKYIAFNEKDIASQESKIFTIYLVPIKRGNEEITVTYSCAGQATTTGKIFINII